MSSTGTTGTARQWTMRHLREQTAGEDVRLRGAAMREDRLARRFICGASIGSPIILTRNGFDAAAHIERAIMEQGPAAVIGLFAAQIIADLGLHLGDLAVRPSDGERGYIRVIVGVRPEFENE